LKHIKQELANPDDSLLVLSSDSSSMPRLEFESVADWASDRYGIGIPDWSGATNELRANIAWKDIKIRIYDGYELGFFSGDIRKRSPFRDIGLMGKRKKIPNQQGGILIGLSEGRKLPKGTSPTPSESVAMSKLKDILEQLSGIPADDSFYPFIKDHSWKPRFELSDYRRNADDRAKKKAYHVSYDPTKHGDIESGSETRDYDDDDDPAGNWLNENG
jgi:hypothetical protein